MREAVESERQAGTVRERERERDKGGEGKGKERASVREATASIKI